MFDADKIPPAELVFLTGTIPGSTKAAFDAIACWSSYIVDLVKSHLSKRGCRQTYSLYVWEFQKRGALHLHYCLWIPEQEIRNRVLREWKKIWTNAIDAVCKKSSVDVWERADGGTWANRKEVIQADAQTVKKSVGAYLAKYLSKQAPDSAGANSEGERYFGPVRWWSVSRPLLKRMRELSTVIKIDCVNEYRRRRVRESICEILTYSENPVYSYKSKDRNSEVFVTYDQANCTAIRNAISTLLLERGGTECDADFIPIGSGAEGYSMEGVYAHAKVSGYVQLFCLHIPDY